MAILLGSESGDLRSDPDPVRLRPATSFENDLWLIFAQKYNLIVFDFIASCCNFNPALSV